MGLYSRFVFPRLIEWALGGPDRDRYRQETLAPVGGEVLEIGFGTGLNLPHYPQAVDHLTLLDSERMLERKVHDRINEASLPVEVIQLDAGGKLPFETGRFDWVVTTWTLCSIERVADALSEIRRALKPRGGYVFLEHGRSDNPRTARMQDFFNPIQRVIGRGCNVNRPIDRLIKDAGFDIESMKRFVMPGEPRMFAEMYQGIAKVK